MSPFLLEEEPWIVSHRHIVNMADVPESNDGICFASISSGDIQCRRLQYFYPPMLNSPKPRCFLFAASILILAGGSLNHATAAPLKIAFVGDSITYGSGTSNPSTKSYPIATGRLLTSDEFTVGNFGVSGATMLKKGNVPYWNQQSFTDSKNFAPSYVVIMLGSNDSKPANWVYKSEFLANAKEMINIYKSLPSHPRVFVNTSPTVYGTNNFGITEAIVGGEVVPLQVQAAGETGCPVTDVHAATAGMPQNFPDTVHPNDDGAQVIANVVYETLRAIAHNDNDSSASYFGAGWIASTGRSFGDYLGDVHATGTNGDSMEFTFAGPRIDYVTELNSDEGDVDIYLDGVFQGTASCYSPSRYVKATVFSKRELPLGTHTLRLVKRSGTWMLVDAFRTSLSTLNDTSSGITYSGSTWKIVAGRSIDYNRDIHATTGNGNYAQATFQGSQVDYLTELKTDKGTVDVYIDGVFQKTVNCYGTSWFSQVTVFRKTGLSAGTHTIKIVKTGGTNLALDAFRFQ